MDNAPDPVPKFPAKAFTPEELAGRIAWLENRTNTSFTHLKAGTIRAEDLKGNIENPIGIVQMPVGLAGPLVMKGDYAQGTFYVSLATTEGALVASYERGMAVLARAGGVKAHVFKDENQICPVFQFNDLSDLKAFKAFVERNEETIRKIAESTTSHGKLLGCECRIVGLDIVLCFRFHTGDAHGMNIVAKAADEACRWLREQTRNTGYLIYSGLSSEKRPSSRLLAGGKGKGVVAVADIPAGLVKLFLRTTPEAITELWRKTVIGNVMAGAIGYCGHFANGLTALFIACGQDVASIMNSAVGMTEFSVTDNGDLRASVTLPSLTLATVGGGTAMGTSRECLEILGCVGTGKARKLAEIAAGTVLAGELSFAGALCSGEFIQAHESLGRNRPEEGNSRSPTP